MTLHCYSHTLSIFTRDTLVETRSNMTLDSVTVLFYKPAFRIKNKTVDWLDLFKLELKESNTNSHSQQCDLHCYIIINIYL